MKRPGRTLAAGCLGLALALTACRGPGPPSPTEDLTPTAVGVIASTATTLPVAFRSGGGFAPPSGSTVVRIRNWPATDPSDVQSVLEPEGLTAGVLLLGGERPDGSWWYELAEPENQDGCHLVYGGSFDEGSSVRLSSGLRLPKAPGFAIRDGGHGDAAAFPGHKSDAICIDAQGRAVYFELFIGR